MRHDSGQKHMVSKCVHSAHPSARLSENLSEETRDAQRRRLEENVGDMSAEARERQHAGNEARRTTNRETAKCDKCGADKTRGEYKYNQWRNRKTKLPTCEACQIKMKQQQQ